MIKFSGTGLNQVASALSVSEQRSRHSCLSSGLPAEILASFPDFDKDQKSNVLGVANPQSPSPTIIITTDAL